MRVLLRPEPGSAPPYYYAPTTVAVPMTREHPEPIEYAEHAATVSGPKYLFRRQVSHDDFATRFVSACPVRITPM